MAAAKKTGPKPRAPKPSKRIGKRTQRKILSHDVTLRSSLTPGAIVILLTGIHAGKRVIMLKGLGKSGNILVAGPHSINKVPVRRVNHRHVIATQTRVDVSKVKVDKFDDKYFAKSVAAKKSAAGGSDAVFTAQGKSKKPQLSEEKKKDFAAVDADLLKAVKAVPMLEAYMKAKFALRGNECPHAMQF